MTPLEAFRAHACYAFDHRDDHLDSADPFGNPTMAPILLPFTLTNGGGSFDGQVLAVDDRGIVVYVQDRGLFRWNYDQIEIPAILADLHPALIRDAINTAPHGCGWTVQFIDHHGMWREAFTEVLSPGMFDFDGITLWQPQGDLDSGVDTRYGDVDSSDFAGPTLTIPYNRVLTVARDPFPASWGTGVATTAKEQ